MNHVHDSPVDGLIFFIGKYRFRESSGQMLQEMDGVYAKF